MFLVQVVEQLENSHELQKNMLLSQSVSLENQERLMNQTVSLNNIINSSSKTVQVLFDDLKVILKTIPKEKRNPECSSSGCSSLSL